MTTESLNSHHTIFSEIPAQVPPSPWPAFLVPRAAIDAEIQRLRDLALPLGSRRAAEIIHPTSRTSVPGVAPGLSVSINVVRPHDSVAIHRDNANRVEFCIGGEGSVQIGSRSLRVSKWDTWSVPSMTPKRYRCEGSTPLVWLSYSNAPLLQRLGVLYSDAAETAVGQANRTGVENKYVRETAPDLPILSDGARLRGYEFLTDIEVRENKALLWPWMDVEPHLSAREGDGKRMIMLLYNPATGRRNGTTHSFFATIGSVPPGRVRPVPARGHKHTSFACNYHFKGSGSSVVDGEHFDWGTGDLMLSAPSWSEHAHGATDEGASVLTIQDHPFQIGIESLIWQERMDGPILTLGSEPGQTGYVGPRVTGD